MKLPRPLFHCCLFCPTCWLHWWRYGAPMEVRVGRRFVRVPGSARRMWKIWEWEE